MTTWSLGRRLAFRFGCIVAVLVTFPFPLGYVPGTEELAWLLTEPWRCAVAWFAEYVLGIEPPPLVMTGSGDTLWHYVSLLLAVTLATLGTIAWTLLDRRTAHPRLAAAMHVLLRYFVAALLLGYGLAKLYPIQFGTVSLARHDVRLGEMSPMGLLWTFMAHSGPYTFIAGLAEVVGAVLLLWRRTTLFGALLLAIVMTNVVLLNLCYDVPVKLFSLILLAMIVAIALPHAHRMIAAALGHATPAVAPRSRGSLGEERARMLAKLAMLGLLVASALGWRQFARLIERPPTALHGAWRVDRHVVDGAALAPDFTDERRWRVLIVHERGATVRHATDRRSHLRVEVDADARTLTILDGIVRWELAYARRGDALVLDGVLRGERLHLAHPVATARFATRGFRWIQDEPYYR